MDEVFDFGKQLEVGNIGEADFKRYYKELSPEKSELRCIDFTLGDGQTVELKTDTYEMNKTPNFFMEMFGSVGESKIGGPWRALQDGVNLFVYYFPKNKTFFWFKTEALCKRLDTLVSSGRFQPKEIRNKGWSARGYAIPRGELADIMLKTDTF